MSISDDGIPLGTALLDGANATLTGESAIIRTADDEIVPITSRFLIPQEPILFPGPVLALNPVIDDIQPRSGAPGTPVIILGRNFTPFEGVVRFNGVVSSYNASTTTRIDTVVPNGATTGRVTVDGFASPFDFTVLAPSTAPTITGFSPTGGRAGDIVSVSGTNLDRVTEVRFNGVRSDGIFTFSPNILQATVPVGAATGPITVGGPTGSATSATNFVVAAGAPTITGFSPTAGAPGTQVTISGTELGGANRVTFNGQDAQFQVLSNTQVRATVPGFVGIGPIRVHTPLGIAVSPGNFTAGATLPTITSFTPTSGRVNDIVTINGTSLDQATGVRIGAVRIAVISRPSNQQITFTVPQGAITGNIILESNAGDVVGGVFTVLPPPSIVTVTGIQPTSGFPGIVVFINGTGLNQVTGASFPPGISVPVNLLPDGRLAVTVPAGATTGPITLFFPGGSVQTPVFTLIDAAPVVTVSAPAAGQVFNTGQSIQVSWTATDDGMLVSQEILYSPDGGATRQPLAQGLGPAERTRQVTLPGAASSNAVILVRATDNTGKTGEGRSGAFRVQAPADAPPTVTVTAPNGGETLTVGREFTISWNSGDDVGLAAHDVAISYDNGASWEGLATNIPGFRRNLVFTPRIPSNAALVSVTARDTAGQAAVDRSDAPFRIAPAVPVDQPPMVTVTSPNGGETLTVGREFTISWNSSDDVGLTSHDVAISYDNGASWEGLATNIPGFRRNLVFTPRIPSNAALVSVTARDTAGQAAVDRSDAPFRIAPAVPVDQPPMVTVTSPNGGETLTVGREFTISWNSSDDVGLAAHDVAISYDNGASWEGLATNIPGFRRNLVFTPRIASDAALVSVTARDTAGQATVDRSDAPFRIAPAVPVDQPPMVTVTAPNGGEMLTVGREFTISWNSSDDVGLAAHDVAISYDNGASWEGLATNIPGFRRNLVFTPRIPSDAALVSVTARDTAGQATVDRSDAPFRIAPAVPVDQPPMVTVTSPNGGETLTVGREFTISWNSSDDVGLAAHDVAISYDNGASWEGLATNIPGFRRNLVFTPRIASDAALVSVTARDTAGQAAVDRSNASFRIGPPDGLPVVTVLSPNGGEAFQVGQNVTVAWSAGDDVGIATQEVRVSYDGGANWESVLQNLPGTERRGVFIARTISDQALVAVRVTDTAQQTTVDRSDALFRIVSAPPTVRVTAPNGGETFAVGQPFTISWESTGDLAKHDVLISYDGGATFEDVARGIPGFRRNAMFTPTRPSVNALVQVIATDTAGRIGADRSDGFFTIATTPLAPVVESVFPAQGPVSGGTPVTIRGRNFDARARVRIGGIDAVTTPVSSTVVNAITPRGRFAGFVNVAVINPDGQQGVLQNGFRYVRTVIGAAAPASGQMVFQSAAVSGAEPDPEALDGWLAQADAIARIAAGPADEEREADISRPLGRSPLLPADAEPLPGALPGEEVVARVASPPEVVELLPGERASFALFAELYDAEGQPVRGRALDIVSGGRPANSTLIVQTRPVFSFSTFTALLATTLDTPPGEYLLRFAGQTLTAPFLLTPELRVPVRVLPPPPPFGPAVAELEIGQATVTDPRAELGPVEPSAERGIVSLPAGATVSIPVTPTLLDADGGRLEDLVRLAADALPPGAVAEIAPNPVGTFQAATLSVALDAATPEGRYALEVSGASVGVAGLSYGPAQVSLDVRPRIRAVEIAAQTVEARVIAGQAAEFALVLSRTGAGDLPVQLLADPASLPAGATAAFDPAAPTGNAAVLRIATGAATPAGTYTVSIGAKTEVDGVEVRGTAVRLVVDAAPAVRTVKLAVTPTSVALRPGGTAKFAVKLNRTNATDVQVALKAAGNLPAGTVFAFTPTRTVTSSSTLVVTLPLDARPGACAFQVAGTTATAGVTIEPSASVAVKIDP